jgi:hypothetical protein
MALANKQEHSDRTGTLFNMSIATAAQVLGQAADSLRAEYLPTE